jgi:hypothetical protein
VLVTLEKLIKVKAKVKLNEMDELEIYFCFLRSF